jgi:ABC-type nitrate/sulfonate/bicarbonate transport system substrate-binding protein
MLPRRTAVIALVLTVAVTAGCGGNGGSEPAARVTGTVTVNGIAFPRPEKTELKFGAPSVALSGGMPVFIALADDLFSKFGLHVTQVPVSGDAQALQALIAGQVDYIDNSAGPLTSQRTKSPVQAVYINQQKVADVLMSGKNISGPADLKGKPVAVSNFGSYSYAEALLSLQSMGLKPDDVTITPVGSDGNRLAALKGGSVAASIQDRQVASDLTAQGFHLLVDLQNVHTEGYVGSALTVPESFAQKYPNTVLALTAAYQMAAALYRTNDLETNAKVWAEISGEPIAQAREEVKVEMDVGNEPSDGRCDYDTYKFMVQVLSVKDKSLSTVDPTKVCTTEFVDKLASMGFTKSLAKTN